MLMIGDKISEFTFPLLQVLDAASSEDGMRDSLLAAVIITIPLLFLMALGFAGYAVILRLRNGRKAKRWAKLEEEWTSGILNLLTGDESPEEMSRRVKPSDRLYFVDFVFRYATKIQREGDDAFAMVTKPFLPLLIDNIKDGEPVRRARAIKTLSVLGFAEYEALILEALDDPSPLVSMVAAQSLVRKSRAKYALALLDRFHRFVGWHRNFLGSVISRIGPEATPVLLDSLKDTTKPPKVRAVAADGLRQLNDYHSADAASEVLSIESDTDLRAACLRLLGKVGRPEHLPVILEAFESDDFVVRAMAASAVGALGSAENTPRLVALLDDESDWVAIRAAQSLVKLGNNRILERIADTGHPRTELVKEALAEVAP